MVPDLTKCRAAAFQVRVIWDEKEGRRGQTITIAIHLAIPTMTTPVLYVGRSGRVAQATPSITCTSKKGMNLSMTSCKDRLVEVEEATNKRPNKPVQNERDSNLVPYTRFREDLGKLLVLDFGEDGPHHDLLWEEHIGLQQKRCGSARKSL